ncbi:hypothetical protein ACFYVL_19685 [Streptomyces sp. NPDC004111]|uniref:hypothetical protein n=1 Tax=Streptomyces sp. NPDC004111 TaxID=3364690 RepID=UPI0036802F0A
MKKLLRGIAYTAIPAELTLVVCLLAGVRVPGGVLVAAEALVLALVCAEVFLFVRLRRQGLSAREAVAELVPAPVLRILGHELRLLASIARWVARRPHGIGPGDTAFAHAGAQSALLLGFGFVCVVETVGMHVLLAGVPVVQMVFLVLDVYTVVLILGLHAAAVSRPHVVRADGSLRVRAGAHTDLLLPAAHIVSVRYDLRLNPGQKKDDGLLELAVASQTNVTVRLSEPVEAVSLLGKRRPVTTVCFHADDARGLAEAARAALEQREAAGDGPATAAGGAADGDRTPAARGERSPLAPLTPERTAPSPTPGRPASVAP